ncbi:MAG: protein phosphatase 2C domain-containing protein [Pseudomonadota bacterium]
MRPRVSGRQSIGERKRQEDAFGSATVSRLFKKSTLLVLADGMGGHAGGDVASKLIVDTIIKRMKSSKSDPRRALKNAVFSANDGLAEAVSKKPELDGMGATVVAVLISEADVHWVSVGDSHLYHIRGTELEKLNDDHSMAPVLAKMVEHGEMSAEDAAEDPTRHALRSAVDGGELTLIDSQSRRNHLERGDLLLLASDGLDTLSIDELLTTISPSDHTNPDALTKKLLSTVEAKNKPGQDNTTVLAFAMR